MISPAERNWAVSQARDSIALGSKSFRFASRLFDQPTRERAWLLYSWCRACDDIADGQSHGQGARTVDDPAQRLAFLRLETERVLAGERSDHPPFEALRILDFECPLPRHFIHDHLAGFARDFAGWRPQTEEDLLSYCYNVAGAVGCLMAVVMGVSPQDEETLDRASDLGIAFQLANIARDLVEDGLVGRYYLPADWMKQAGLAPESLTDPANRERLAGLARRLAALARTYEESARVGAARLSGRSRWAVLSAAGIYGAIARKVAARGTRAWDSRTIIPKSQKLVHVLSAGRKALSGREALAEPGPVSRSGLWTRPR